MSIAKITKIINWWDDWQQYFENPLKDYDNIHKDDIKYIYWEKRWSYIRHVPDNYSYPNTIWYALMRSFNCQARCIYCYLQSYYKSWDIVSFTNIEDYISFLNKFIIEFKKKHWDNKWLVFYDWDFQDSLGYFGLQKNIEQLNKIIDLIEQFDNVFLEIRTKNLIIENWELKIGNYKKLKISDRVIYAITFSPQDIIEKYEIWASNLDIRIEFWKYIISRWWLIWIRIDPIIFNEDNIDFCIKKYNNLIEKLKQKFQEKNIVNWSIWILRLKEDLYKQLRRNKSDIINNLSLEWWFWRYKKQDREKIYSEIKSVINSNNFFVCMDDI